MSYRPDDGNELETQKKSIRFVHLGIGLSMALPLIIYTVDFATQQLKHPRLDESHHFNLLKAGLIAFADLSQVAFLAFALRLSLHTFNLYYKENILMF